MKSVLEVVVPDLGGPLAAFRVYRVSPGGSGRLSLGLGFHLHSLDGEGLLCLRGTLVSVSQAVSRCRCCELCQVKRNQRRPCHLMGLEAVGFGSRNPPPHTLVLSTGAPEHRSSTCRPGVLPQWLLSVGSKDPARCPEAPLA